jgi:hypothetical protein
MSDEMLTVPCPTCGRKGMVKNPNFDSTIGDVVCQTCCGNGWVRVPAAVAFGKRVSEGVCKEGTLLQEYSILDARFTGTSGKSTVTLNG